MMNGRDGGSNENANGSVREKEEKERRRWRGKLKEITAPVKECHNAMRRKRPQIETGEAKRKNGEAREAEQGEEENDEIEEEKRRRRVEMERGRGNKRQQYARKEHLRLIIDHLSIRSLCSQPTLRNHYVRRVVFSTVKNPPCRGGTVRCFFLDSKCRRHKCLFDLMTRCPTRTRAATYTREHLSPSLRSFRVSVGRATGPYVALLILLRKKGRERERERRKTRRRLGSRTANAVVR